MSVSSFVYLFLSFSSLVCTGNNAWHEEESAVISDNKKGKELQEKIIAQWLITYVLKTTFVSSFYDWRIWLLEEFRARKSEKGSEFLLSVKGLDFGSSLKTRFCPLKTMTF